MRLIKADSKQLPKCAFCVHWGDTEYQHIRAVSGGQQWKYNELAVCCCKLKKTDTRADFKCEEFTRKI